MRGLLRGAAVGLTGILASCTAFQMEFSEPVLADKVNFTLDVRPDAAYVNFTDNGEVYRIDKPIYDKVDSYMNDDDRKILRETLLMREILQTADVDGNFRIDMWDVRALYFSRDRVDRLIILVNMHYKKDSPKIKQAR
jgi:hypothetical protein